MDVPWNICGRSKDKSGKGWWNEKWQENIESSDSMELTRLVFNPEKGRAFMGIMRENFMGIIFYLKCFANS